MAIDASPSGQRLDSWKAIADYLQRDVATVRRWEKGRGLPVRRVPGGRGSSVYAYTAEIDAWLRTTPPTSGEAGETDESPELPSAPAPRRPLWHYASLAAVAVAAAALTIVAWNRIDREARAEDLRVEMTESEIAAFDRQSHALWSHGFDPEYRVVKSETGAAVRVVADGEAAVYAASAAAYRRADDMLAGGELLSFSPDGTQRWSFTFADRLTMGGQPFGPPWMITTFAVSDFHPRRIAVASHHAQWGASVVAVLDDRGARLGTFSHAGWLEGLFWLAPDRLVVSGFSDSHDAGMIGLVDPTASDAQGPEPPGSPHYCESCGQGMPLRMAVMPRTEVNRAAHARFNRALLEATGDRLIARTIELPSIGQEAVDALYEFTPELAVLKGSLSARYWELHRALEEQGKLNHSRDECPDRDGPRAIEVWTPETGWRTQKIR